ncbi:MAG: Na/Pi cotransporter family protein [Candidatus Cellulosilyticum pullistercoris]|uniref:Na/Pi cotransporter family protein n=1 Tax=Candidatus Cellulosilyticum pullistercoris TaxID=2838521 RepID=A0A9E2KBY7_9FIRM|nr:Na/Pi cotransporter family protein [Candidatus Cellulosilyticum pullistercoris]
MDFFNVLTMLGGLALFLYGMHTMGEGLSKISGGRLEKILEKLTSNPFKAVALGAIVTAVIQSSSATTVMVVGFVNSGIMKLSQAIGIIMGANIGTTITSWILSLSGIESSNFFIKLLKPSSFAPILALIGVAFIMFSKKEKKKDIGMILVGFGILMVGMDTMSGAVKPLADVPAFTNLFVMFSNPILGMLAGALLTAIIQSSSASVGILQALCATGSVSYASAFPIIMGQNIGTCVTAIISSVGASKNARRAALVHLYFNVIGTIVFMVGFYAINAFVHFSFMESVAGAAGIALIHTIFNVIATLILLPFTKGLEKLAYLTIREDEVEKKLMAEADDFQVLDVRFLDSPSFAIAQCKSLTVKMAELSKMALFKAIELLSEYDENKAAEVENLESRVDRYEDEIGSYLIKLSRKNILEKDSHTLSMLLHLIGDFERISDHAVNIMEAAKEMHDKGVTFSSMAEEELKVFSRAVRDIINISIQVFEDEDKELAVAVEPLEEVIDHLNEKLKKRHIERLREGVCTIELGFIFSDIKTNYERVADHCSNIAICIIQLNNEEGFDAHEYLEELKREDNTEFREKYNSYKRQYRLP